MQRSLLVASVAAVVCLSACGVMAATEAAAEPVAMNSLAFEQEVGLVDAQNGAAAASTPRDWSAEETFLSSFVEVSRKNTFRKRSNAMAHKFVSDMHAAMKKVYPKKGALTAAAKAAAPEFDKHFREQCKRVSPSHKMCKNFVTIQRLQFRGKNLFAKGKPHHHRKRFHAAVRDIILRYVHAWRHQHPKRAKRGHGNPWAESVQQFRTEKVVTTGKDGKKHHHKRQHRLDVFHDTHLSTGVRGALTAFGRINAAPSKGEKELGVKPKGDYPLGSALDNPHDESKPYKAHKHVKLLREQVLDDLTFLREKLYAKISDKKLHRMLGDPERAPHAIRRTARLCKHLRAEHFFPPTFCRSLEYLASVHWVGRNFLRNVKDFSALMASFMDHNHAYTTRYGYRVHRKPNYRQDVTVVRANVALKLRPNKFNLRTFAREWVNILSNTMSVPQHRIRVASVKFGGFGKHHRRHGKHHRRGRRHTQITFEFLPKKGDRRIRSRPHTLGSVDSLAEQFRSMALDRPKSPLYKVPMLSRVLPKSLVLSKTLGRRPKNMRRFNLQSANVPRFAAQEQTLSAEVAINADEEVSAGAADAESQEFEQSDAEFMESDEALDAAETETADEEAEADDAELNASESEEMEAASQIAASVAAAEAHAEQELMATMQDSMAHAAAAIAHLDSADASDVGTSTEGEVTAEGEVVADAESEEAEAETGAETAEEAAEEDAAEAAGEVAFLQIGAETAEAAALHLDVAETMTQREIEAEEEAEAVEDEADADEAEEAMDEAEEEADEAAEAAEGVSADEVLGDSEEVESDAEWNAALMEQSEQLVATTAADDEGESDAEDADAIDADAEEEVDDEFENESDAEAEAEAESESMSANALTAPPEQFASLPEVFADKETERLMKAETQALAAKAEAPNAVEAALAAVDAAEAADETVFVETSTTVQSTTLLKSSSSRVAVPAFALALLALVAVALNRLW